jgi:opacity protein-like surface antigen
MMEIKKSTSQGMTNMNNLRPSALRSALRAGAALFLVLAGGVAPAQQVAHPGLTDRWTLQIGAYFPQVDTTASLNGTGGRVGTSINFEDDLNLTDRKVMPSILASVRLGERWRFEAEYLSLRRSGSRTISRTINWGDSTYPIGATVHSEFDSDIYRLSGGYSFIKDSQRELGIALGLHATDFSTSLSATGVGVRSGETLAPLPTIGLYGAYAFSPKWLVSGRVDYFSLSYEDYDGSLTNLSIGVDYRVARNFAVGLAWRHVDYDVSVTKPHFTGGIRYKFNGPALYGVLSF